MFQVGMRWRTEAEVVDGKGIFLPPPTITPSASCHPALWLYWTTITSLLQLLRGKLDLLRPSCQSPEVNLQGCCFNVAILWGVFVCQSAHVMQLLFLLIELGPAQDLEVLATSCGAFSVGEKWSSSFLNSLVVFLQYCIICHFTGLQHFSYNTIQYNNTLLILKKEIQLSAFDK